MAQLQERVLHIYIINGVYTTVGPEMYIILRSVILRLSYCLTVNVPYVHLLPRYRPKLDVSLPPEVDPKILACCVLAENLT
jgi:hypothetical protein